MGVDACMRTMEEGFTVVALEQASVSSDTAARRIFGDYGKVLNLVPDCACELLISFHARYSPWLLALYQSQAPRNALVLYPRRSVISITPLFLLLWSSH